MTDTDVIPPIEMPEVVPDDFKAEFACTYPGCTKSYPTRNGVQGHMTAHKPPIHCPECGKEYKSPGALGNHRKQLHGSKAVTPTKPVKPSPKAGITTAWHSDDIFNSVVQSLWPAGSVPTRCILPLMEWREATREFLEKVQSE